MNIEKYNDLKENKDIEKVKMNLSKAIIEDIINNNIALDELSDIIGISVEKLSKIILEVKQSNGSELMLVSTAIDKVLKNTNEVEEKVRSQK